MLQLLPFQLDDAYITYRYAQNFLSDGILSFNTNQENTEGFTSFFWFLCSALWGFFKPSSLHLAGPVLGFIAYCLCFLLVITTSKKAFDKILQTAFLAFLPNLLYYSVTGLETTAFALAITVICLGLIAKVSRKWLFTACAIAPWLRPEAPWLALIFFTALMLSENKKACFKLLLTPAIILLISQLSLLLIRYVSFGDILPNTYYEKQASANSGIHYLGQTLSNMWALPLIITAILLTLFSNRKTMLAFAFIWLLTPLITGADWMPHFRFLLPAYLLFIFSINTEKIKPSLPNHIAIASAVVLFLSYAFSANNALQKSIMSSKNFLVMMAAEDSWLQSWMHQNGVQSVAAIDIGKMAYQFQFEVFDLGGLTDKTIASISGQHMNKELPMDYFFKRSPDAVIIRLSKRPNGPQLNNAMIMSPIESSLALNSSFNRAYQPVFIVAPNYSRHPFYGLLVFLKKSNTKTIQAAKKLPITYHNGTPFLLFDQPKLGVRQ